MANPALNEKTLQNLSVRDRDAGTMTVSGTINKTGILFVLLLIGASYGWAQSESGAGSLILIASLIAAFGLSLTIIFKKTWAPRLAPAYALAEGVVIGSVSAVASAAYPGIVSNAVSLTLLVMLLMLGLYRFRILQATPRFQKVVIIATGAIALLYLVNMVMSAFSHPLPMIHESGNAGMLFSLAVVVIAALNLIIDFDMIEKGASAQAPKYFEWYSAFALMLTLVWLYLEILRMLSKGSKR